MSDAVQPPPGGGQPTSASPVTPPFPTLCLPPAGNIGDTVALLDTPCLVLDADALERNLDRMQAQVARPIAATPPRRQTPPARRRSADGSGCSRR